MFDKLKNWYDVIRNYVSTHPCVTSYQPNENFDKDFQLLLKDEGGLSNDINDPGGITKYGISIRFLQDIGMTFNGNSPSPQDILNLTQKDAKNIYKKYFWDNLHVSSIENSFLQNKVFNLAVNMGGMTAIKLLQEAINSNTKKPVIADGIIGEDTLTALHSIKINELMQSYRKLAIMHYVHLVSENPKLHVFLKGWLIRADE